MAETNITDLLEALRSYRPERIYLVGSYARGEEDELSDIDLVIIKDTAAPFLERMREVGRLLPAELGGIDLLVYSRGEFAAMLAAGNGVVTDSGSALPRPRAEINRQRPATPDRNARRRSTHSRRSCGVHGRARPTAHAARWRRQVPPPRCPRSANRQRRSGSRPAGAPARTPRRRDGAGEGRAPRPSVPRGAAGRALPA